MVPTQYITREASSSRATARARHRERLNIPNRLIQLIFGSNPRLKLKNRWRTVGTDGARDQRRVHSAPLQHAEFPPPPRKTDLTRKRSLEAGAESRSQAFRLWKSLQSVTQLIAHRLHHQHNITSLLHSITAHRIIPLNSLH